MSDFEVAPIGYIREIQLSRELANTIAKQIEKEDTGIYPQGWDVTKLPVEVRQAYNRLYGEYIRQQQAGEM
jgi:hypothetical protein